MRTHLLPILLGISLALLTEGTALAQINFGNIETCPVQGVSGVGCYANPDPNPYLFGLIQGPRGIKVAFIGILFAMLIFYGLMLLLRSRDENAITEARLGYFHAVFGAFLVGGAFLVADTFTAGDNLLVNEAFFNPVVANVIIAIKALIAIATIITIVIQAILLIMSQAEDQQDKARKRFIHAMIGAAIVILADVLVDGFFGVSLSIVATEVMGIARFLVTLFGALCVIGVVVAGLMLVFSVDEGAKDRAKKIITACLVALAVIIAAYGLVTVFLV